MTTQTPEYIQWPGQAFPGGHTFPAYDDRADGSTVVHAHNGAQWTESADGLALAVAKLAQGAAQSAVVRMQAAAGGQTYYFDGTGAPPFAGERVGDTARGRDYETRDILSEWRWTGDAWVRLALTSSMVSALDVGKLTAGYAALDEAVARKFAAETGQFIELDVTNLRVSGASQMSSVVAQYLGAQVGAFVEVSTSQLTVSDTASVNTAVVQELWSRIIHATSGEFEQITAGMLAANSVTADALRAGAIDGMVITGATVQTSASGTRVVINAAGFSAYRGDGSRSVYIDSSTGAVTIDGNVGISDAWSRTRFVDIGDSSSDSRRGVGLEFTSLETTWASPGLMTIDMNSGVPGLNMQAPMTTAGTAPYLRLSSSGFEMWSGSIGTYLNSSTVWSGKKNAFSSRLKSDGFRVYGNGDMNSPAFYTANGGFSLRSWSNTNVSVWGADTGIVVGFNSGHYSMWNSSGMSTFGGKNFIMSVPEMSEARGGMMLRHASTESPWDGIEYWQTLVLDVDGAGTWVLPDYVPRIASSVAPAVVLCSTSSGTAAATLTRGQDEWTVTVTGEPGATVSLLVKAGRVLDRPADGTWYDRSGESLWVLPPMTRDEAQASAPLANDAYGPATQDVYARMTTHPNL